MLKLCRMGLGSLFSFFIIFSFFYILEYLQKILSKGQYGRCFYVIDYDYDPGYDFFEDIRFPGASFFIKLRTPSLQVYRKYRIWPAMKGSFLIDFIRKDNR